jgi:hypothetical protein
MTGKNHRRSWVFSLVLISAFLMNGLPLRAQDVVTSEDFSGGSSAFVFKTSRKPTQKKVAFRATTSVTRTKTAKLESVKRITRQTVSVAKVNPKRTRSKEVAPETVKIDSVEFKRKTPQETSVIFAGVGEYHLNRDDVDKSIDWFRESVQLDEKNANAKTGLSDALARKGDQLLNEEKYDLAKMFYCRYTGRPVLAPGRARRERPLQVGWLPHQRRYPVTATRRPAPVGQPHRVPHQARAGARGVRAAGLRTRRLHRPRPHG